LSQIIIHTIEGLENYLRGQRIKNIFLVRGHNSYKQCGAQAILDAIFQRLGILVTSFKEFTNNPKYEDMLKGKESYIFSQADAIVAVGGGSAIDTAKAIHLMTTFDGEVETNKFVYNGNPLLPFIAIPTTAGTGSEATHFAVLYKDGNKYSLTHQEILPVAVLLYPPFTYDLDSHTTASTGFDAFAQAVEAYWNVNATSESDIYALQAIELFWDKKHLLETVKNPELKIYRAQIQQAAFFAGQAINITQTTAPHAFSYKFTNDYGYSHGHAVALTFPFFFGKNIFSRTLSDKIIP
jgi:alcohol dehydrogenase class IV